MAAWKYQFIAAVFVIVLVASAILFFDVPKPAVSGTTFTWQQTNWNSGVDAATTHNHTDEQASPGAWVKYDSQDGNVVHATSGQLTLLTYDSPAAQTSQSDFGSGTFAKTTEHQTSGDVKLKGADTIAFWKFEDDVTDETSNNHNGTVTGTATYNASGKIDKAFDFDQSTYITASDHADLDFADSEDITIETWVYLDDVGRAQTLIDKHTASGCSGSATACSSFGSSGTCAGQSGCSWDAADCSGSPSSCSAHSSNQSNCTTAGCTWDAAGPCGGIATSCSTYDSNESNCDAQLGCTFSASSCTGTHACNYGTEFACNAVSGCSWDDIFSACNGTPTQSCSTWNSNQSSCNSASGCSFNASDCAGFATSCASLTEGQCSTSSGTAQFGCSWDTADCSGSANACTSHGSQSPCESSGCSWDAAGPCGGTPDACSTFGSEGACTGQGGCSWDSTSDGYELRVQSDNTVRFTMYDSATTVNVTSTDTLSASTWYHVVVLIDRTADTASVYINDGTPVSGSISSIGDTSNSEDINFGRQIQSNDEYLDGRLDEVRIYNRLLDTTEITRHYNSGSGVDDSTITSGTFISSAIDTGLVSPDYGTLSWSETLPGSTDVTLRLRSASTSGGLSGATWYGPTGTGDNYTTSGTATHAIHDGDQWIQYEVTLSTSDTTVTPTFSDMSLTFSHSPAQHGLISTEFDTGNANTVLDQISWTETLPTNTDIQFQLRTAPDSSGSPGTWTDWVGTDGTSGTYFSDNTGGDTIPSALKDGSSDQWFQYKAFLSSTDEAATPTLSDVTVQYVINTSPVVSSVTASQGSGGDVTVGYTLADADSDTPTISLFYDVGATVSDDPLGAAATTVNVSDGTYFPTSGTIQIDSEEMTYTGKSGNQLTGVTRSANSTAFYNGSHTSGTTVWIKAVTVSGDVGSGIAAGSGKSITWTAATDLSSYYAASTAKVRVSANDQSLALQIGTSDASAFELDTKDPTAGTPTGGGTGINVNQNTLTSLSNDKVNTTSVTLNLSASDDTALQMILSNDGVFDTETYESYSTTKAWTLSSGDATKTVYAKFKDAKGNETTTYSDTITLDTTAPDTRTATVQDISNASAGTYRLFVSWTKNSEGDWVEYDVHRSTDDVSYSSVTTISDSDTNFYQDNSVSNGTTYYYKVESTDDIGNNSAFSTAVSKEAGSGTDDVTAPTISSVASGTLTDASAIITWTTNEVGTSVVTYSTDSDVPGGSDTKTVAGYVTSHSVQLTGLTAGTTYYYYVTSCDAASNCSNSPASSPFNTFATSSVDATAPTISSVSATDIHAQGATVTFTTNESATSFVEYSTTSGWTLGTGTALGQHGYRTSHTVNLRGLTPSTTYYFKARAMDAAGNLGTQTTPTEGSFTTGSAGDVTGPVISSIASSDVAYNSATVTWTTDEKATSFVEYGTTTNYGATFGQDDRVLSHSVNLPNDLAAATTYNYRVHSRDAAGNETISSNSTFTTSADPSDVTAPTISSVSAGTAAETSVTITWTTNEEADSIVDYDTGGTYSLSQSDPTMTTSHSVTLVGLDASTQYTFRVRSSDPSGNEQTDDNASSGYTFVTRTDANTKPVISNVRVTSVGHDSAVVLWSTSSAADSFVEYGFDTDYGLSLGSFGTATAHSVTLPSLATQTTYHFRVRSLDANNLEVVSQDFTFTTGTAPDITPPVISSVASGSITETTATITWTTDTASSSIVDYGTSCGSLTELAGQPADSVTSHSVDLAGLTAGTVYYYQVESIDAAGNGTTDDNSSSCYTFTATADTTAPTISNVATGTVTNTSAVVTWETNEISTSQAGYGLTTSFGSTTTEDATQTIQHSATITGLSEETTYFYKVISKDAAGNTAEDDNSGAGYSFTTTETPGASAGGGGGGGSDTTPPTVSAITIALLADTTATITWKTNEPGNSLVNYGLTSTYGSIAGNETASATSHVVTLNNLFPATLYNFQVVTRDAAGNRGFSDNQTFTTLEAGADPVGEAPEDPVVDVPVVTPDGSTTVQVPEDIPAEERSIVANVIARIRALADPDSLGDVGSALESAASRIVAAPFLGGNPRIEVTSDTARVVWNTDKPSNSIVWYATDQDYQPNTANPYTVSVGDPENLVTTHEVILTGLEPNQLYHVLASSQGEIGPAAVSDDLTFQTLSETPDVTQLDFREITDSSVTVTWATGVPTRSTIAIENTATGEVQAIEDESFLKEHLITIDALLSETAYALQVTSQDEEGNQSLSGIFPFTTAVSTAPPAISSLRISTSLIPGRSERVQTLVSWSTNKPATSQLFYGQGAGEDLSLSTLKDETLSTNHTVVTVVFKPGTIYRLRAVSEDASGNEAQSADFTILTPKPRESLIDLITSNFEDVFGFLRNLGL